MTTAGAIALGACDVPLRYLRSLQASDGSVRYSRSSTQTPVWVTAQALTALERRPFPLRAVRARHRAARGTKGAGSASGTGKGQGGSGASGAAGASPAQAAAGAAAGSGGGRGGRLRRASERLEKGSGRSLSPAVVLLLSGAGFMLLSAGASWRYRRLARR